jgi:hypothetical protein
MSENSGQTVVADVAPEGPVDVTFYSTRTGAPYSTSDPVEITRLRASRGHAEDKSAALAQVAPENADPGLFDPNSHTVSEVIEYLSANPGDYERVMEVERAGKNRAGIVGSD